MCFNIHFLHKDVKIAKRDIPCYKLLERGVLGNIASPFHRELYFSAESKKRKVTKEVSDFSYELFNSCIYEGLHSFSNKKKVLKNRYKGLIIYKAIIPQDTKYYYNPATKEYVSLKLTVLKSIVKKTHIHSLSNKK